MRRENVKFTDRVVLYRFVLSVTHSPDIPGKLVFEACEFIELIIGIILLSHTSDKAKILEYRCRTSSVFRRRESRPIQSRCIDIKIHQLPL